MSKMVVKKGVKAGKTGVSRTSAQKPGQLVVKSGVKAGWAAAAY